MRNQGGLQPILHFGKETDHQCHLFNQKYTRIKREKVKRGAEVLLDAP